MLESITGHIFQVDQSFIYLLSNYTLSMHHVTEYATHWAYDSEQCTFYNFKSKQLQPCKDMMRLRVFLMSFNGKSLTQAWR